MNYIDILLCIPLLWGIYKGFTKGLIVELASLIALSLGIWGAVKFSELVSKNLLEWFNWQTKYLHIIAFALIFLCIVILIYFFAKLLQRFAEGLSLGLINKIAGAVFGFLKIALIMSVIIFMIDAMQNSYSFLSFKTKEKSLLYKPIGKIAPVIIPALGKKKIADGRRVEKVSWE